MLSYVNIGHTFAASEGQKVEKYKLRAWFFLREKHIRSSERLFIFLRVFH